MRRFFTLCHGTLALLTLGVLCGIIAWQVLSPLAPPTLPPDPARVRAWDKVAVHLQRADMEGAQVGAEPLQRIEEFFADRQKHVGAFAEEVLGWRGKWSFVKGKLFGDGGKAHQEHLRQAFERHLFTGDDLQQAVQAAVAAYLSALEGQENALLVAIRADLSDTELPALRGLDALQSDAAFLAAYRKLLTDIVPVISRDLKITVGREAAVWVGSDVAAAITLRIASAVVVRLGISGGILSTGAASGTVTLGVGLVAGFILDGVVDWIMRRCGYDPAGDIARHTGAALERTRELLIEGAPEHAQQGEGGADTGGALGLRRELERLRQVRGRLREVALRKLVLEGESP